MLSNVGGSSLTPYMAQFVRRREEQSSGKFAAIVDSLRSDESAAQAAADLEIASQFKATAPRRDEVLADAEQIRDSVQTGAPATDAGQVAAVVGQLAASVLHQAEIARLTQLYSRR
ncbi:MAG: hypothetical protein AB7O38_04225 [Pirellulaceae bacterium]